MALTEFRNCKLIDLTKLSNHKLLRCKNVKYRPEFAALCRDCVKRPSSKKNNIDFPRGLHLSA